MARASSILASYLNAFGDHSGIPGSQLLMFKSVAEPLLGARCACPTASSIKRRI